MKETIQLSAWPGAEIEEVRCAPFVPARLTTARERRQLSKDSFAKLCTVSRRAVTDWESGRVVHPPVEQIAEVLHFPVSFFSLEVEHPVEPQHVSFRALTSMSARTTRAVLASASIVERVSGWIDDNFATPQPDLPWTDQLLGSIGQDVLRPGEAAEALRAFWGLGTRPIRDLTALLESRGVRIFSLDIDAREVDAFSLWLGGRPTIFLNCDKSAERLRFDLAHELGHLVMHRDVAVSGDRSNEVAANDFASSFLMPAAGVMARATGSIRYDDILSLKKFWRVSAMALVVRLNNLHLMNDWQYRNWMVELSSRGFRRSEPAGIQRERSELLTKVLRLAREDGLGASRLAAILSIPEQDLVGAVAGLTLTPMRSTV